MASCELHAAATTGEETAATTGDVTTAVEERGACGEGERDAGAIFRHWVHYGGQEQSESECDQAGSQY